MITNEEKKNWIIQLLTLEQKQIQKMDQEQIIDLIKEIDIIKKEAVQDQRYYG